MCSSDSKVTIGVSMAPTVPKFNGRPVLQPTCNRVPTLERRNSVKKISTPSLTLPPPSPNHFSSSSLTSPRITTPKSTTNNSSTPPISPKSKSPRPPAIKRGNDGPTGNGLNSSSEKVVTPGSAAKAAAVAKVLERKKSKSFKGVISTTNISGGEVGVCVDVFTCSNSSSSSIEASLSYSSSLITESPGSIAAVRREQIALQHAQRKMKIAHYGRSKSAKFERVIPNLIDSNSVNLTVNKTIEEEKRCSFITANSDPIYVAYHDQEWGVPVHDDKMLFELLVLSGAQVGSDWTSILKKREEFRNAFSGFDADTIASFTDKQMVSISTDYGIDISRVRGVVDNSNRILEIKREFGSFEKYVWGFVNQKPISTQYKSGQRIPVKTSKSESISKDMVRRGFRFVGPTVVHSVMQAAGLTNDHLITCHRHLQCTLLGARRPSGPGPAPVSVAAVLPEQTL
ncbi:Methyladenine glycosylase [Trema orientale]|uniref:Methyladenine glycosylase n=1 Tax=Trema orientale TaxID=63057 RepID=A0A2P5AZ78_TREOI|nr:Methyladenine glycosylase [Trema orientale]